MLAAILILIGAAAIFWLIFFKFKLLRLTPGWGFIFALFMIHVMLVFMIGLRFVTPVSANATMVQHTIQLIPRLTGPALVTEVMVQDNDRVKKGQPLFQFDRRPGIVRLNSSQTYLKFQRRSAAARSCVGYRRLLRLCVRERQCHPIRTPHEGLPPPGGQTRRSTPGRMRQPACSCPAAAHGDTVDRA